MKPLQWKNLFIPISFAILLLIGCNSEVQPSRPIPGIDEVFLVDNVAVRVLEARLRSSYSTVYIMTHAPTGFIFYEVIVSIDGFEEPKEALTWGIDNLSLDYKGEQQELETAVWTIEGDDIKYTAGEEFTYRYMFLYKVVEHSDYATYKLQAGADEEIDLSAIVVTPKASQALDLEQEGGTVGGGEDNQARGQYATVSGGSDNIAGAIHTFVGGGNLNIASAAYTTVSGGRENHATYFYATIGGGYGNTASGRDTTISGGTRNTASHDRSSIGGGIRNQANASDTTISGGTYNETSDVCATIGGGTRNQASGFCSTISGGAGNHASQDHATASGGLGNHAAGIYATVSGGHGNFASGAYASVPGGQQNQAGGDHSLAAGQRAIVQQVHPGSMLWADANDFDFVSTAPNEFAVRATGGVRLVTAIDENGEPLAGVVLTPGGGGWSSLSARDAKANLSPVDTGEVLDLVAELPLATWNYNSQPTSIRHLGPMAEDFYAAFGLGENPTHINSVDADGIALAAIQGLNQLLIEKDAKINTQEEAIARLEAQQAGFEDRLTALESSLRSGGRSGGCNDGRNGGLPLWNGFGGSHLGWIILGLFSCGISYLAGRRRTG